MAKEIATALVVPGDKEFAQLRDALKQAGYIVFVSASDLTNALGTIELFKRSKIKVCIVCPDAVDMEDPIMEAEEILNKVKEKHRNVVVVCCSKRQPAWTTHWVEYSPSGDFSELITLLDSLTEGFQSN